jgi:crotonobetainyl-CoA:carnitine CoA-transferase CaiB-like acyl-CoA transferase
MSDAPKLPLDGLRVIEVGAVIAAPFCASVLADLGAEVIKVEPPKTGDPFRAMGPSVKSVPLWWGVASRNKRCVTMDLKSPIDKRRFEILVSSADIFIENNRPGALDRLGLGYSHLTTLNPRLIMVSISGFGQTGPDALRPGFGKIAEAMSGQVAITGRPDAMPYHIGFSLADTSAGLSGVFAIAMLLYLRDAMGRERGAYVDIALFEPLMRMQECQFALHEKMDGGPVRQGSNDPYSWGVASTDNAAIKCHVCADGAWVAVMTSPMSASQPDDIGAFVGARLIETALTDLAARGVEAVRVHDGSSLAAGAYFRERGDVQEHRHPEFSTVTVPGFVPRVHGGDGLYVFRAPVVGEDDEWLGVQTQAVR